MKLAIVGSRSFNDWLLLKETLSQYNAEFIISGGANGADKLAHQYALVYHIEIIEFLPDWSKYRRSAGAIRNKQIVDSCDELLAFWDNKSPGTKISIDYANKTGKKVTIISI